MSDVWMMSDGDFIYWWSSPPVGHDPHPFVIMLHSTPIRYIRVKP
jgi:hypothetical protein